MSCSVDPAGKSTDYSQSRVSQLVGQLLRRLRSVVRGASRADDANGVMIALLQFAPNVKHNRRRMNLAQGPGIRRRLLCDDNRAEITDAFEFPGKIDSRFPIG